MDIFDSKKIRPTVFDDWLQEFVVCPYKHDSAIHSDKNTIKNQLVSVDKDCWF